MKGVSGEEGFTVVTYKRKGRQRGQRNFTQRETRLEKDEEEKFCSSDKQDFEEEKTKLIG